MSVGLTNRAVLRRVSAALMTMVCAGAVSLAGSAPAQAIPYGQPKVTVGAATTVYGSYAACNSWGYSTKTASVTCSTTLTVSNSFSGSVGLSNSTISANVGFNVTRSWSESPSYTYTAPARTTGVVERRRVYSQRKVTVTQLQCNKDGMNCYNETKVGYAKRFVSFQHRGRTT